MALEKNKNNDVNRYFMDKTQKVYIERCNSRGIETFEKYLSYGYKDASFYYSMYALMGLKCDDSLVKGYINFGCGCERTWVEFTFNAEEYVFDPKFEGIVTKQSWYEEYKPKIEYKCTQQEILDQYLNEENAIKIKEGFWQFKDIKGDNKTNVQVFRALRLSRIELREKQEDNVSLILFDIFKTDPKETVKRFIAYDEPTE